MSNIGEQITALTRQLYPKGRVFNIPEDSNIKKLHVGIGISEVQAYEDALSILDAILPDNANFTTADATDWERRLGMITNPLVSLADRKEAIKRKMNHPGDIPARQSWDYLQQSLQDAGFNVYVHENIPEKTLLEVLALDPNVVQLGQNQLGNFNLTNTVNYFSAYLEQFQLGQTQLGQTQLGHYFYNRKVVNHIEVARDVFFDIGDNFRSTFFIGGVNLGDFATVDINRRDEFRQLILKIKPVQSVGFLLINYI